MSAESKDQIQSTVTGFFQDLGAQLQTYSAEEVVVALATKTMDKVAEEVEAVVLLS